MHTLLSSDQPICIAIGKLHAKGHSESSRSVTPKTVEHCLKFGMVFPLVFYVIPRSVRVTNTRAWSVRMILGFHCKFWQSYVSPRLCDVVTTGQSTEFLRVQCPAFYWWPERQTIPLSHPSMSMLPTAATIRTQIRFRTTLFSHEYYFLPLWRSF